MNTRVLIRLPADLAGWWRLLSWRWRAVVVSMWCALQLLSAAALAAGSDPDRGMQPADSVRATNVGVDINLPAQMQQDLAQRE
jgi:hypothetical protein